jgi:protein-disulfide isomerase
VLYAHQSALKVENLKQYASQIGLDQVRFDAALDSGRFNAQVQRDVNDGNKVGVNSTPVFFVNGKRVSDSSYEGLKAAIEASLRR